MIGNKNIISQIRIAALAARKKNQALPHMLFSGTPGCGKTTTAKLVSKLTNYNMIELVAENINNVSELRKLFATLPLDGYDHTGRKIGQINPTILFIDEIHGLSLKIQEILGIAMETWKLSINSNVNLEFFIPEFTLIGATTSEGKLSIPFLERFKLIFNFKPYSVEESVEIVKYHAQKKKFDIDDAAALEIARRGRGIPRILVSLLERVIDFSIAMGKSKISAPLAIACFALMKIDKNGFTENDIELLYRLFKINSPVGLDNLAVITGIPKGNVVSMERYLVKKGLVLRSSRGRIITREGMEYLRDIGKITDLEMNQALMERL